MYLKRCLCSSTREAITSPPPCQRITYSDMRARVVSGSKGGAISNRGCLDGFYPPAIGNRRNPEKRNDNQSLLVDEPILDQVFPNRKFLLLPRMSSEDNDRVLLRPNIPAVNFQTYPQYGSVLTPKSLTLDQVRSGTRIRKLDDARQMDAISQQHPQDSLAHVKLATYPPSTTTDGSIGLEEDVDTKIRI